MREPPKPLIMEGNLLQNWKLWKQEFNLFMIATEYTEKAEQVKTIIYCYIALGEEPGKFIILLLFNLKLIA